MGSPYSAASAMPEMAARSCVMEIEALYLVSRKRRLSNRETADLAGISARLAERAEREATIRVPEFTPVNRYAPRYW
jgi:hypothetical protein